MPQTYNPISIADDPIPETHREISRCFQTTCKLTQHVDDNYIPDDIVNAALNIMREQSDETFLIGQLTPAEMELAIVSNMPLLITQQRRQCINIHHVNDHWVTSTYDPVERNITVYDSLKSMDRISQLQKQLNILYGYVPKIHYIPIKQQGNETTCGLFAIAAAFSVFLGIPPETQDFDVSKMRTHLKKCINLQQVVMFPTSDNLLASYFQTQKLYHTTSTMKKRLNKNIPQNRKEYRKLYKQSQRQQPQFKAIEKENDIKRKRKKQTDPTNKQIQNEYWRESKRKELLIRSIGKQKMNMIDKESKISVQNQYIDK